MLLRYRGSEGMLAWAFHRISGLAIWVFIVLHVFDIRLAGANPKLYGDLLVIYGSAPGRVGEMLLGAALLYHALNGLRIVIMDFWPAMTRYHAVLWRINWAIFAIVGLPVAYVILKDWNRREKGEDLLGLYNGLSARVKNINDGTALVIPPPAIQGIGNVAGATMKVEIRDGSFDYAKLQRLAQAVADRAGNQSMIQSATNVFLADAPQLNVEIEKLATYALRRGMALDDRAALAELARRSKDAGYRLSAIVEALALSDLFQKR